MYDLNDLYYFAQVVKYHGFAPAGRELCIPKSKLSRRVAALEERLGVRLIQRSTRHFSVTESGALYYQHCKAMLVEAAAAQEVVDCMQAEPRGTVRVTCPIDLLQVLVGDMLVQFMSQYPSVTVHLEATNRRVDPVAEGIDVAIRVRPLPLEDSDLVFKVLAQRRLFLVASPDLFAGRRIPQTPAELYELPSLDLGPAHREHLWELTGADGRAISIRHQPSLVTDSMVSLRSAALAGLGVVELPSLMISEQLEKGQLITLLPQWNSKPGIIHIVYPSRRGQIPVVRLLIDFLAEHFAGLGD